MGKMSHAYIQQEKAAKNNIEQIIAENISHDLNLNFLIKWPAHWPMTKSRNVGDLRRHDGHVT